MKAAAAGRGVGILPFLLISLVGKGEIVISSSSSSSSSLPLLFIKLVHQGY
jgi:hypothetical protein